VPGELGLPRNEQERLIGSLINQVINKLPQERRKGYLLRPQEAFTYQGMIERILEADGITREMIEAQQKRLSLIQRLVDATPDESLKMMKQEEELIDGEFFILLRRISEVASLSQEEATAQRLAELQEQLMEHTTYGKNLLQRTEEWNQALQQLQAAGNNLTREKLLDMVINANSEIKIQAYVSMARPLMDYAFFQLLSEKIDRARGDGRLRLSTLRDSLLELTRQIDQEIEAQRQNARKMIFDLINSKDIKTATEKVLPQINDFFLEELDQASKEARKSGDLERIGKYQQVMDVIKEATKPPEEIELIEEMLSAETEDEMKELVNQHEGDITPEFVQILSGLANQIQNEDDPELRRRFDQLNRMVVRLSMSKNLR
jgi:hypothetical protein